MYLVLYIQYIVNAPYYVKYISYSPTFIIPRYARRVNVVIMLTSVKAVFISKSLLIVFPVLYKILLTALNTSGLVLIS